MQDPAALLAALVDARADLPSELRGPDFERVEGRRIVELRPAGSPMKGAAVERLIEQHGGTIRAVNNRDRGVSFLVSLPVKQREEHAAHSPAGPGSGILSS